VPDRHYFYPTNVLSTARDIITLWVARMVMSGLYNMGRVPFQHVCIHPTIQDGRGRRMSKSAGNGLDPVDLIERYGADALRFSLASMAGATQDVRVPISYLCPHCQATFAQAEKHLGKEVVRCEACQRDFATRLASEAKIAELGLGLAVSERFEEGQRFCNKLWQAATGFVLPNLRSDEGKAGCRDIGTAGRRDEGATGSVGVPPARPSGAAPLEVASLPLEDRWILSRLAACVAKVDAAIDGYQYSDAAGAIYSLFWSEFCDWYVELVKPRLYEERDEGTEGRRDGGAPSAPGDLGIEPARDQGSEAGEREPPARASADAARQVLAFTLDQTLRLLHPIAPFVTEALWRRLNDVAPRRGVDSLYDAEKVLIRARWPSGSDRLETGSTDQDADRTGGRLAAGPADSDTGRARARSETGAIVHPEWRDAAVEDEMEALQEVIRATRDVRTQINKLRAQAKQPSLRSLPQVIIRADAAGAARLAGREAVLRRLGRCAAFEIGPDVAWPSECFARVLGHAEVYVPVGGLADLAIERQRLTQEREELAGHARRIEGKLANEGFVSKAPAEVVAKERQRLDELRQRIDALEQNLREFGGA
jgi:valyl-tRNA synthetase